MLEDPELATILAVFASSYRRQSHVTQDLFGKNGGRDDFCEADLQREGVLGVSRKTWGAIRVRMWLPYFLKISSNLFPDPAHPLIGQLFSPGTTR